MANKHSVASLLAKHETELLNQSLEEPNMQAAAELVGVSTGTLKRAYELAGLEFDMTKSRRNTRAPSADTLAKRAKVVSMYEQQEMTFDEIGAALGISRQAVHRHYRTAKKETENA